MMMDLTDIGWNHARNISPFYAKRVMSLLQVQDGGQSHDLHAVTVPYLPYIFGRIKIIIFFTVRTFNLEKNYKFFSVRIFMNAEKLPIIEDIHRYICGNFNIYTERCENKQFI